MAYGVSYASCYHWHESAFLDDRLLITIIALKCFDPERSRKASTDDG